MSRLVSQISRNICQKLKSLLYTADEYQTTPVFITSIYNFSFNLPSTGCGVQVKKYIKYTRGQ